MTTDPRTAQQERTNGDGELFEPSAENLRILFEEAREPWSRESAVAFIRELWAEGHLKREDVEALATDYPELAGFE